MSFEDIENVVKASNPFLHRTVLSLARRENLTFEQAVIFCLEKVTAPISDDTSGKGEKILSAG